MKPRIRPIKNLYFRWGSQAGLTGEQVAEILVNEGLIEQAENRDFYFETPAAKKIADFNGYVTKLLKDKGGQRHG